MLLEHALLPVVPGQEEAFEAAFAEALPLIAQQRGFVDLRLSRCVEEPSRYLLLVTWERLEDHTEGFRGSPAFGEWRGLIGHLFDGAPDVEHFAQVAAAPAG